MLGQSLYSAASWHLIFVAEKELKTVLRPPKTSYGLVGDVSIYQKKSLKRPIDLDIQRNRLLKAKSPLICDYGGQSW